VTGIAYVQLDDDGSRPVKVPSDDGQVARIELRPSILDQLQNRGLAILEQTEEIAKRINNMLAPANQQAILAAFDSVNKAATQLETIPRQLEPTLAKLPTMANQAQQALSALTTLSKDASVLTGNLNGVAVTLRSPEGPLAKLAGSADQIGAVANKLEHETLPLAGDARSSIRALNRTLNTVNEHPQSVLFGSPATAPGPGEPGFSAPTR
jgi:phospholipid/cholesterol/gamma-HCH transport system substrate-binding protein